MSRIIGIDLGTSTSEIAIMENGRPRVLFNSNQELITPSVVQLKEDGTYLVGLEAKEQFLLHPHNTVMEVKRLMGSSETIRLGSQTYSPTEISSFILKYLVTCAEEQLNEKIDRAVITVPAYFSDEQRRATVEAGKLAGLKVERIINEPTAAALDYGIDHMDECHNIMIYDLGGGTLDVTVLEFFDGILDVKASSGNNRLGGKDFDEALMDDLILRLNQEHQQDIILDKRAEMRLKDTVENCKIALSAQDHYKISLPFFTEINGNPISLEQTISKENFEALISPLIQSTENQIDLALKDAKLSASEIDLILLVGGSTRIPLVQKFVATKMGKTPKQLVDPDLSVVRGACIQAAIINEDLSSENDILITDVCPYTLGTSILSYIGGLPFSDIFDVLIPRNVTIPTFKEKIYTTSSDFQEEVAIKIYQGENKKASLNNFLGEFHLKNIPPAPAFEEKINISFSYDVNGILHVEATIVSTGKKANISVETTGVEMVQEVDLTEWASHPEAKRYRAIIGKTSRILENDKAGLYQIDLESLLIKLKEAIVKRADRDILDNLKDELTEILYELTETEND
ncbi:Hsp70 family protein [Fusibacter sp. 3D3]|uniref:Hsp70 family protein n=1 Tax=Fusibacter sp. 3D3 TaxID=1048380 RepID=UPI000852FD23|nr:Hsp70 family protein [Fusibacter sp. 3D3]GAU77730.1 chaperone protein DnaK [Fusibacter sp. 3D3]